MKKRNPANPQDRCGAVQGSGNRRKPKRILAFLLALSMICSGLTGCRANAGGSSDGEERSAVSSAVGSAAGKDESSPEERSAESDSASARETEESSASVSHETGIFPGTPDPDMITVNITTEPPNMNTVTGTDATSHMIMKNTMENLIRLDREDRVSPGAAESWDISDDGLTYTFHLREGMLWQNGDPVTAKDFEFAWRELLNPEVASEYAYFLFPIAGAEAYNSGEGDRDDVKATAVDELTFEVVLHTPTEYFLSQTSFDNLAPVNERFYNEVGAEKYGTEAEYYLSNGPYRLESWTHESEIVMVKNENYFNADAIRLEKVRFVMILDSNASLNAFQAGEIDVTILSEGAQVKQVESKGYEVQNYSDGSCFYLLYNFENPVLANQNIRKALSLAVDQEIYVKAVWQNSFIPATSFTPAAINGLERPFPEEMGELVPVNGDPEAAKAAFALGLTELGITAEEAGKQLSILADDNDGAVKTATFVQEQFKSKLGLDLILENVPFKNRLERATNGDFSVAYYGWSPDYNDPNTFLDMFMIGNGNNKGRYANEDYDQLIRDAAVELDPAARMDLFYRAEQTLIDDYTIAPLIWRMRDFVVSEKVGGIYRTAFQDMMFTEAYLNS